MSGQAAMNPGTAPVLAGGGVRWETSLLEASHEHAVAAWRDCLHGFAKRLPPQERARFLLALDSAVYPFQGEAAQAAEGGLHPKHRILGYHDFFASRIRPGERVIDLGCGVGALAASIAQRSQALVTGVDWNEKNLMKARALCEARKILPAPRFVEDDITTYRVEGTFDVVVLSNVLEHIKDRSRQLRTWREWYGAEKFLIRVPAFDRDWRVAYKKELGVEWRCDDTHEIEHTRGQLEHELGEAGLAIVEIQCRWGEYWLEARAMPWDEGTIREPRQARRPREYFLPPGYVEQRRNVTLDTQRDNGSYWSASRIAAAGKYQYHVYRWARALALRHGLRAVVDVGCGTCAKLDAHLAGVCPSTAGIDQASALRIAREQGTTARLIEADLERPALSPWRAFDLVVCADVLEHLLDPDPTLDMIRSLAHPGTFVLFSTPDRERERGRACNASPKAEHVREWSAPEFARFLDSRGFAVVRHRMMPNTDAPFAPTRREEAAFRHGRANKSPWACQAVLCTVRSPGFQSRPSGGSPQP